MAQQALKSAKTLFQAYKGSLATLEADIGEPFLQALSLIQNGTGHGCVGYGQIGYHWSKDRSDAGINWHTIFFLHPAEAIHGDLGMVRQGDVVLAISNSGIPMKSCGFCLPYSGCRRT